MRTRKRCPSGACLSLLLALALLFGGCTGCGSQHTAYRVEIRPLDDGFTRAIEVKRIDSRDESYPSGAILDEDHELLVDIYGPGESSREGFRFDAAFGEEIPADVGVGGALVQVTNELGVAYFYHEQLRGNFPPYEQIAAVHDNLEQLINWIVDWLGAELEGQAGADELCAFIDGKGRTDAHDTLVLLDRLRHRSPSWSESTGWDNVAGPLHLLIDRGYFTHAELARWTLTYRDLDEQAMATIVLQCIAKACGLPDDSPAITFLRDTEARSESFESYLKDLPEYAELMAAKRTAGDDTPVSAGDLFEPLVEDFLGALFIGGLSRQDEVTLLLHTGSEPQQTNGQWDDELRMVRWSSKIPSRHAQGQLPLVAQAKWYRPSEQRQQQLFGEVLFQGESLAEYFRWRQSLDEDAADAWGQLLDRMGESSADQRRRTLQEFRSKWVSGRTTGSFQKVYDTLLQPVGGTEP